MNSKQIKKRFEHVRSSLIFCNKALSELYSLQRKYDSDEENILAQSHPFNFYNASLTYVVIMEYCKIMEYSNKHHELSSIKRLWEEIEVKHKNKICDKLCESIKDSLIFLKKSTLSDFLKKYRDKKFGHSDDVEFNKPLHIPFITLQLANETFKNLILVNKILLDISILEQMDYEVVFQDFKEEKRTQNFIRVTASAREFYFKNYLQSKIFNI